MDSTLETLLFHASVRTLSKGIRFEHIFCLSMLARVYDIRVEVMNFPES